MDRLVRAGKEIKLSVMTEIKVNKNETRTRETRELLLKAAETIFVRDGYEGAELGEIAALAGRTKGSIYANFKSKEEIFLELIDQHTKRNRAQMEEMLGRSTSVEGNLAALRQFALEVIEDKSWALLFLEFKLFAIRHPESRERLQKHFDEVIPGARETRFSELLGAAGTGDEALSRVLAIQALFPMLSALVVETNFVAGLVENHAMTKIVNRVFDALLQPASSSAE